MGTTKANSVRYRGKVLVNDPMTNPENGWVEGFYYEDLDNGVVKSYIFNPPMRWEVDPNSVKIAYSKIADLDDYENPVTTQKHIKELQEILVQTTIDYIKEHNLEDIWRISFDVDGLYRNAIKYGEWTPAMDSFISVEGIQIGSTGLMERRFIGECW